MIFRGLDLIEPIAVPDDYVLGIGRIEEAGGGNLRVYFYTRQNGEYVTVRKLVVPADQIEAACRICLAAAEGTLKIAPSSYVPHLN